MRLISADDVCRAVEAVLVEHLDDTLEAAGWDVASGGDLTSVRTWDQVPTLDALSRADLPAGAIESPGLAGLPARTEAGWSSTWRVVVGIYDRGETHDATAAKTRRWAAAVRATVLDNAALDGLAQSVTWVTEAYAQQAANNVARTLGGCAVGFDITVPDVVTLPLIAPANPEPVVESTHTAVTVVTIT